MSGSGNPHAEKVNAKYSTQTFESDDHRRRHLQIPLPKSPVIPSLEVQLPTPRGSALNPQELAKIDEALQSIGEPAPISRDFENAIDDDDKSGDELDILHRRGSTRPRRTTNRQGRAPNIVRLDRSRDTSSSRSTSPANSVEAFAEPRRRQRANTIASRTSSVPDFHRARTYSNTTGQRRPTLSNISVPPALTQQTDRDYNEAVSLYSDDEPGKTYKIDFEELDEFVALCAQGKIPDEAASTQVGSGDEAPTKHYHDIRQQNNQHELQNVILNPEHFYEKPVVEQLSTETTQSSTAPQRKRAESVQRFSFFSSEIKNGLNATKLGDFTADGTTFRDLFDVGPDGGVWWLDVLNPTKAELDVIAKAFKIHRLTREDIETQEAREKVELFAQYYFVCFRSFNMDKTSEDYLDPIHVYIVVCGDGVLSFSYAENPHARNVRKRIAKLGDFVSLGPDYICYAMIDDIVDSFAPIIRSAEQESENIEDQVFIAREDDLSALLKQIGECRKSVLNLMRLLGGKADVIKGFAKRCNEQYEMTPRGDIGLYLGDIQDHVVTMMSNLGHVEKMLSRSHANYLAQLNVDNILKGNSTNKALAKITVVATILVPLNLITGLFGMNVTIPGQDNGSLGWFFGILGAIALFVTTALLLAKKFHAL